MKLKKLGMFGLAFATVLGLASCNKTDGASSYTVTFKSNGGSTVEAQTVDKDSTLESPYTSKAGNLFSGWYTDEALTTKYDFSSKVTGDLTLYAGWTAKTYHTESDSTAAVDTVAGTRYSYATANYEERTEILGLLEKYAVNNGLTGLTIYGDGAYVKYDSSVKFPTKLVTIGERQQPEYIKGFGFGVLSEGELTSDLAGETTEAYKRYYHVYETTLPATLNYMNDKGSVVGDLIAYVASSYYDTKMTFDEDGYGNGYEWAGVLAKEKPIAVNADSNGLATEYKFRVNTGEDGFVYNTLSTNSAIAAFKGTDVEKDDYLTPFKILHNKSFGFARAGDNFGSASGIKGDQDYYNATGSATTWADMDAAWEKTMGKYVKFDSEGYLHITFNSPVNPFYAMYYSATTLYTPIPKAFIDAIGGAKNLGNETSSGLTPVDTYLSTGPYVVEKWTDQYLAFKKNELLADNLYDGRYNIAGVHVNILSAANTDTEAAWKEFTASSGAKLHSVSIPSTQLDDHKNDIDTYITEDSSTYKINMNVCDEATWVSLFGKNGSIVQTAEKDYWTVKPAMANRNFQLGLSYALDRLTFANTYGRSASVNFFGNAYLSNPEDGIIYNETDEHKAAMSDLVNSNTDAYGYSKTLAQDYFTRAAKELTEAGKYKSGDTVTIEIAWQTQAQVTTQGATLKQMFEDAFNTSGAKTTYGLTLVIENWTGANWYDVYYDKMMVGQFDLGFGSISGNSLNPLNFLEVLKSDNSSGFTLNWGTDTNVASDDLTYDGKTWSFDSLWQAADTSVVRDDQTGAKVPFYRTALSSSTHNTDGSRTITFKYSAFTDAESKAVIENDSVSFTIAYYDETGKVATRDLDSEAEEFSVTINSNGDLVITVAKEVEEIAIEYDIDFSANIYKTGEEEPESTVYETNNYYELEVYDAE